MSFSLWLVGAFAADQAIKLLVLSRARHAAAPAGGGASVGPRPAPRGRTFASRAGVPAAVQAIAWVALVALVAVVTSGSGPLASPMGRAGLATALGGAAANVFDVFARGGVVDYLVVGRWPPFNAADAAIAGGVVIALLAAVR